MEIDVDALLAVFDGDSACGDDLEYDADFIKMVTDATPVEEQQVGDSVLAGEDADFSGVAKLALGLLKRSKDYRVAIHLGEAVLHNDGFVPFERCLAYIAGLCQQFWECAHPELDEDDDNDPTMRVNALLGLVGAGTVLRAVRRAALTDSKVMGRFSLRDISVATGEISKPSDMDDMPEMATISAAFQDTDKDRMTEIRQAIANSRTHITQITAVFDDKIGVLGPDLSELDKTLAKAQAAIAAALGDSGADETEETVEAGAPAAAPTGGMSGGGAINTNDDVNRMLDRICDYYARVEPSSPVPVLLKRARRLVGADFVTIIKDMASEGVNQVNTIGGIVEDNGY